MVDKMHPPPRGTFRHATLPNTGSHPMRAHDNTETAVRFSNDQPGLGRERKLTPKDRHTAAV